MFRYEHKRQPLASRAVFIGRLLRSLLISMGIIGGSLAAGVIGYMATAHLGFVDAFLNASMILGGMGPVAVLDNDTAKIFAGVYALYSGLVLIAVTGIILAPAIHRVLHALSVEPKK
jgi:hypothetical protein